jgi:phosphatidylserine decarboxylase
MSEKLKTWVKKVLPLLDTKSVKELSTEFFFRDPVRPTYIDNEHFYSPADGIILYQKVVQPEENIVEIKGLNYTIKDVLGDKYFNKPSLVIGVFMTFLDPHINRIPYGGLLQFKNLEPIESTNKPMLAVEKDILNKVINHNNMDYLKYNERMWNKIYIPSLDYTYYVVQIADEDVNVIVPFTTEQNEMFTQNERFSLIRWGSQTELILPLDDRFEFSLCQDTTYHVEAGLDKLVKITKK